MSGAELGAIGVYISRDSTIEIYGSGWSIIRAGTAPARLEMTISRLRLTGDSGTSTHVDGELVPIGVIPTGAPRIITDFNGNRRFFNAQVLRRDSASALVRSIEDSIVRTRMNRLANVDGLIPIRVAEQAGRHSHEPLILWYAPSAWLFDALPPCLRDQLLDELDPLARAELDRSRELRLRQGQRLPPELRHALDSINTRRTRVGLPCERPLTGGPLLDGRRSRDRSIKSAALTPNNVETSTSLRIELTARRKITVWLHDLRGRRIREILPKRVLAEGRSELALSFEGAAAGLYFVVVETSHGERAVLRAIVE